MKRINELARILTLLLAGIILLSACKNEDSLVGIDDQTADKDALLKLVDEDDAVQSFEPNYNEEDAMDFLGKTNTLIYPVKVGQRMKLVSRSLDVTFEGDSAIGVLTKVFEGKLIIAASYDEFTWGDSNIVDTVIIKDFSTTVTRNILFVKVANTEDPCKNWRIRAISLPEGGTLTGNINITRVTMILPDGVEMEITDPNNYYLGKEPGMWPRRMLPTMNWNQEIVVRVEVASAYPDTDFVTLTYGAFRGGEHHRAKRRFELVSQDFDGTYYNRVFEQTWRTRQYPGWKHAIINAVPYQTVKDDAAPVEENTWGIPYRVLP